MVTTSLCFVPSCASICFLACGYVDKLSTNNTGCVPCMVFASCVVEISSWVTRVAIAGLTLRLSKQMRFSHNDSSFCGICSPFHFPRSFRGSYVVYRLLVSKVFYIYVEKLICEIENGKWSTHITGPKPEPRCQTHDRRPLNQHPRGNMPRTGTPRPMTSPRVP